MRSHVALAALVAASSLGLSLLAGTARWPALAGAAAASTTALASLLAMARVSREQARPVQRALMVIAVFFLVRIVLVGAGTALVARSGASILAFAVAFFVPDFAFTGIEASFVHSVRRREGSAA